MNHNQHSPDQCTVCNSCTVFCPVAEATRDYPGPKMVGPAMERFRRLKPEEDTSFEYCSNCKTCDITCPSGVPVSTLNMLAKAEYYKTRKHPLRDWILSHGELMAKLASPLARLANLGMANPLTQAILRQVGVATDIQLPRYATRTFAQQFRKVRQTAGENKVVLFPGCYINYYDPQTGLDFVAVMQANGYEVIVPEDLCCCGSPLVVNGYLDEAWQNAAANIRSLKEWTDRGYPVVACCTSCGLMLKQEYQELFGSEATKELAGNIHDASEFLLGLHEAGKLNTAFKPAAGRFIYHAPCHLRAQGIGRPSLELLALVPGLEVTDADAGCCGISGNYGFKRDKAHIAAAVGRELFARVAAHAGDGVISECGTCRHQIAQRTGAKTYHPLSILRRAYD